jgi:hypothetical protein
MSFDRPFMSILWHVRSEPEETAIASEQHSKHASTSMKTNATKEKLLWAVFSMQFIHQLYKEANWTSRSGPQAVFSQSKLRWLWFTPRQRFGLRGGVSSPLLEAITKQSMKTVTKQWLVNPRITDNSNSMYWRFVGCSHELCKKESSKSKLAIQTPCLVTEHVTIWFLFQGSIFVP